MRITWVVGMTVGHLAQAQRKAIEGTERRQTDRQRDSMLKKFLV